MSPISAIMLFANECSSAALTSAAALHLSCTVHIAFFQIRRTSPLATKFAKRTPGDEHRQVAAVERHHLGSKKMEFIQFPHRSMSPLL